MYIRASRASSPPTKNLQQWKNFMFVLSTILTIPKIYTTTLGMFTFNAIYYGQIEHELSMRRPIWRVVLMAFGLMFVVPLQLPFYMMYLPIAYIFKFRDRHKVTTKKPICQATHEPKHINTAKAHRGLLRTCLLNPNRMLLSHSFQTQRKPDPSSPEATGIQPAPTYVFPDSNLITLQITN